METQHLDRSAAIDGATRVEEPIAAAAGGQVTTIEQRARWFRDSVLYPFLGILAIFVVWQLVVLVFNVPKYMLAGPLEVFRDFVRHPGYFLDNSWVTLVESILGFIDGVILGFFCGLAVFYIPLVRSALYPALIGVNTIPKVALAPLFVVWFGAGTTSKVVVALLIAFFPVLVSTVDGLSSVPPEMVELAAINDASPLRRFWRIDFMYALPSIFTGMKVSISMAVGGAVVGEFIAGHAGLGFIVTESTAMVDIPSMFGSFVVLSVMSFVLFLALGIVERVLLPWAKYRDSS
jgi:NitT/TauT family transport system permease protein